MTESGAAGFAVRRAAQVVKFVYVRGERGCRRTRPTTLWKSPPVDKSLWQSATDPHSHGELLVTTHCC